MSESKRRILFVCLGNICRSPTGEGVLRHLIEERGLQDRVEVDSAGTGSYHVGEPPDGRMTAAAHRRGIHLTGQARQFAAGDFDRFDLIIAMDRSNQRALASWDPRQRHSSKIRLFGEYLNGSAIDVPDPYYGGPDGFDRVLDIVEEGCPRILDELLGPGEASE